MHASVCVYKAGQDDNLSIRKLKILRKLEEISAHADGGPRSRVCARETLDILRDVCQIA